MPARTLRISLVGLLVWIMAAVPVFSLPLPAVTVTVSPTSVSVPVSGDRQFTAQVNGAANTAVTWTVNDIPGGNVTVGTIDSTGKFTGSAVPPTGWTVTVKAVSVADPNAFGASVVTIRNQIPWVTSVVPNALPLGPFSITVNGSRFVSGAQVLWNGTPLSTNFVNAGMLTATGNAGQKGNASVTVANPGPAAVSTPLYVNVSSNVVVVVTPASANLLAGASQQYQATVSGTANLAVIWMVNGKPGGDGGVGTITGQGLYTAPGVMPVGNSVTISALSAADGVTQGTATAYLQDPLAITYGRFLEQTTFGPTAQLMAHAQQVGMQVFLDEQFATPESTWPSLVTATRSDAVDAFYGNAKNGQDQLRQRTIFALSEVIVIAMNKNTNGNEIVPWLQLLSRNSFGNYRTLLKELTLDASMGKYLDLANSGVGSGAANENYPREVMQLFSIGLYQLNPDGSRQLDATNQPIPTYSQTDVQQLAKALTGWTYSSPNGTTGLGGNWNYFPGPMIPVPGKHNTSSKTFLGQALPANQTIQQDLNGAIDIIFNHPNVAPFIATRLIRALVTSNPSPAYIARVAAIFNDNGQGVRGDMQAVIRAIIMDQDARNDTPPADFGRLRTPMQHTIALARALNLNVNGASGFAYLFYNMNEGMLDAPSVFGHYSPLFRIPKSSLYGPEFQIYSASDAINRANFFYSLLYNPWPINPALQPFVNLAGNSTGLINAVDNALLYGRMSPATRNAIAAALPAQSDNNTRALAALYLTITSGEYLVQH
ncbi:MAG: hypothetical protein JWM21_245 [Acidobacteria bacterium]|nr:hypothetical protein [Acidobacteriota bacterium]